MHRSPGHLLVVCGAAALTHTAAWAGTPLDFIPLSGTVARGSLPETTPFALPGGFRQELITSFGELQPRGLPSTFLTWDMGTFAAPENGTGAPLPPGVVANQHFFIPSEVGSGAGVFRYDLSTGGFTVLMQGNTALPRSSNPVGYDVLNDNFSRLDPATYTPFNTVLTGEETSGGRLFEIQDPFAGNAADADARWLSNIPAVAHEGLRFGAGGELYFVDENNTGSLYKFVPSVAGDLSVGQSFVLSVDAFTGNAAANWNASVNVGTARTGAATWVALTDAAGNPLTTQDPFDFNPGLGNAGRLAADEVNATPYGRPEDLAIGTLHNGNEVIYMTATSEDAVYAFELTGPDTVDAKLFALQRVTLDAGTGLPVAGTGLTNFNNPDNLAIDADGNVYIVEDQNPGDIWRAVDVDGNGIAEAVALWASLSTAGSEPSGLIQDPLNPDDFFVLVQHPTSNALVFRGTPGAVGEALVRITVPEPGTAALIGLGAPAMLRRRQA